MLPFEASSVIVSAPVRVPAAVGVNVTFTVHWAPAASVEAQLLVSAKSPDAAILEISRIASPVLDSVTVCAELVEDTCCAAKVKEEGESDATGPIPVPDSETEGGVPVALLLSVSEPVRVPRAAGTNTTLTVQVAPAPRLAGQLFVCVKSPDTTKPLMDSVPVPVLVRITFFAELVVPTR